MDFQEFVQFGFRWPRETTIKNASGVEFKIVPTAYLLSRENQTDSERERKTLRLYNVWRVGSDAPTAEELHEVEVEALLQK
jgi:hypothetical protein